MNAPAKEAAVVHLVDDDDSLRKALSRVLSAAGHEVRTYASAADFLLERDSPPRGCLVLDVRMPGGPSGLELQRALARQGTAMPVIFLTGHGDIPMSVQAIKDGAHDFLTKPVERAALLASVASAMASAEAEEGRHLRKREVMRRIARLTPSERKVFIQVVKGQANKQIAADLGCSERTVKAHRAQVMAKMEATSLADLVHQADLMG